MKLIITESAQNRLLRSMIREEFCGLADKVNIVKDFLDKNFLKATNSEIGEDGHPKLHDICIWVDAFKQPKQYMNDTDLFYLLQDQFKNILPPDDDEEENSELEGEVEDIFNKAYKDASKKVKKVTHNNRDKFLKQCLKDWYYGKISKNGSLSLYEGMKPMNFGKKPNMNNVGRADNNYHRGDTSHWNLNNAQYREQLQTRMSEDTTCKYSDDNSLDGHNVIESDINFLVDNFFRKKTKCPSLSMLINDIKGSGDSDTSPDLYRVMQKMLSNRATVKWCFICPKLSSILNPKWNELKMMVSNFGENGFFKSKEERDLYLPFYIPLFKKYVTPLLLQHKDLKAEIDAAIEMTNDLNMKIEEYLNNVGFEYLEPINFETDDLNSFNDFETFN